MHTSQIWRTLVLVLALAFVATACRGGDDTATPDEGDPPDASADAGDDDVDVDDGTDDSDDDGDDDGGDAASAPGVTSEACPDGVNQDNGCIYLGTITDFSGAFQAFGEPLTEAQEAYWREVNEAGGIGGYDIDVTSFVRDNEYEAARHLEAYDEIRGEVFALAQTLGSPTTAAILEQMEADDMVGMPAGWTSANDFDDEIVQVGANYCTEAMNAVDFFIDAEGIGSVMAVHYPGDYGDDAAVGAREAAERAGIDFTSVQTGQGQDNQGEAIGAIVNGEPDLVVLTVGPVETATIVGQAAAQGVQVPFVTSGPGWAPGLLGTDAAPALTALLFQAGPAAPFNTDSAGHERMRTAIGDAVTPNEGHTAGWVYMYPLEAALRAAADSGDLTRSGLKAAFASLDEVDFEGMLPPEAGRYSGTPDENTFRQSVISKVTDDPEAATGVEVVQDFFAGPTAEAHTFDAPCFPDL